jgi:hypothetical protein
MYNRSPITNDPRRLAPDVSLRSPGGRRFADIFDALSVEFPGASPERLREAALAKFTLEQAQASGGCSLEDFVRLQNVIERKERALRAASASAAIRCRAWPNTSPASTPRPSRDGPDETEAP